MNPDKLPTFMFLTILLPWAVVVVTAINAKRIPFNVRRTVTPLLWLGSVILLYLCWNRYAILHPNWQNDHAVSGEDISEWVLAAALLSTVMSGLFACFVTFEKQLGR